VPRGVAIAESPDRPAVIHGVQHMFHTPAFLERWPSDDCRSRLVFIARDLPRECAQALLDAIEVEVRETTRNDCGVVLARAVFSPDTLPTGVRGHD
jgi:hypothetical protein